MSTPNTCRSLLLHLLSSRQNLECWAVGSWLTPVLVGNKLQGDNRVGSQTRPSRNQAALPEDSQSKRSPCSLLETKIPSAAWGRGREQHAGHCTAGIFLHLSLIEQRVGVMTHSVAIWPGLVAAPASPFPESTKLLARPVWAEEP